MRVYLWHDADTRFGSPAVLSGYLRATGDAHKITRQWLEQRLFEGEDRFTAVDFFWSDLRHARFEDCDFEGADFSGALFSGVEFRNCDFSRCKFDGCAFEAVRWFGCRGFLDLDTDPETYERLADELVRQWESNRNEPPVAVTGSQGLEVLFQTYNRAYRLMEKDEAGDETQKDRLLEKSREVREKLSKETR